MRPTLVILVFGLIVPGASVGAAPVAAPTAEVLYAEGQAAYDRGDFATAIARWQASFRLSGASGLLFNVAQAYRQNGQCADALGAYQRFVVIDPIAAQRELADDFIRELTPQCGAVPSPARPALVGAPGRSKRLAGIAIGGAGAVLLVTGLGFGQHASALGDEITRACAPMAGDAGPPCAWADERAKDAAGRRDATLGRVLDVAGLAALGGGAALYYLGSHNHELAVAPLVGHPHEGGAVLTWTGAW